MNKLLPNELLPLIPSPSAQQPSNRKVFIFQFPMYLQLEVGVNQPALGLAMCCGRGQREVVFSLVREVSLGGWSEKHMKEKAR